MSQAVTASRPALDLNAVGRRLLSLCRAERYRLSHVGDALIFLDCDLSQSDVDKLDDVTLILILAELDRSSKLLAWKAKKRTCAVAVGDMIDLAPEQMADELSAENERLLASARRKLGLAAEYLEAGCSVRQTAREIGCDESTLRQKLVALRG